MSRSFVCELRNSGGAELLNPLLFFFNTCEYHLSMARDTTMHYRLPRHCLRSITTTIELHPTKIDSYVSCTVQNVNILDPRRSDGSPRFLSLGSISIGTAVFLAQKPCGMRGARGIRSDVRIPNNGYAYPGLSYSSLSQSTRSAAPAPQSPLAEEMWDGPRASAGENR